jgi:hypothetical protein
MTKARSIMPRSKFPARAAARQTSRPSVGFAIIRKWPAWAAGSSSRSERAKRGGSSIRLTKLGPSSGPRWRRSGGSDDSSSRAAVTSRQEAKVGGAEPSGAPHPARALAVPAISFFAAFKVHISCAFGRSTGKSPHQRLLIRRQGPPLACWTELSQAEIALAFGFCNQSHTSPEFLRRRNEPRTTPSVADARAEKQTLAAA